MLASKDHHIIRFIRFRSSNFVVKCYWASAIDRLRARRPTLGIAQPRQKCGLSKAAEKKNSTKLRMLREKHRKPPFAVVIHPLVSAIPPCSCEMHLSAPEIHVHCFTPAMLLVPNSNPAGSFGRPTISISIWKNGHIKSPSLNHNKLSLN